MRTVQTSELVYMTSWVVLLFLLVSDTTESQQLPVYNRPHHRTDISPSSFILTITVSRQRYKCNLIVDIDIFRL